MSYIAIRATQSTGLIACAKHYFLYEQSPVCTGPENDKGNPTDCRDVHAMVDGEQKATLRLAFV
jgi:beta-glucosidase